MATGTGDRGEGTVASIRWVDPEKPLSRLESTDESEETEEGEEDGDEELPQKPRKIDLEFEWYRVCHACGEHKRFSALICDECRERHGLASVTERE